MYDMRITLIIPAKNEEKNILHLLRKLPDSVHEIIVIDGNSTDNTFSVANEYSKTIKVIKQKTKGKGAALSRGFCLATGDFIITIDADGSNEPNEIQNFIEGFQKGFQLVKGSRYLSGGGSEDITWFRSLGNIFLTNLVNLLYNKKWSDLAYGYIGISKDLLDKLKISNFDEPNSSKFKYGSGFEIEALICCRAIKKGAKIIEIPSFEKSRVYGSSNLKSIPDGIRALFAIIYEKFKF